MIKIDSARPIRILLAEDEPADIELVKQAFKQTKIMSELSIVNDGVELLEFLRKEGRFEKASTPDLILLDLNMPRMSGREALSEIRKDPRITSLPVVVMTSSPSEEDIVKSYQLHANCFVRKPLAMSEFEKIVTEIEYFWFSIVTLPRSVEG
jgi:chemotaxis family two-component system response regulator Rcp1